MVWINTMTIYVLVWPRWLIHQVIFTRKKKQKPSCPVALKPVVQYDRILPCNPILSHCLFFSFPVFDVHRSNDNWGLESFLFLSGNSLCMHYSADLRHWQQNHAEGDLFIRNNKTPAKPSHCGAADGTECFMAAAIKHPDDLEEGGRGCRNERRWHWYVHLRVQFHSIKRMRRNQYVLTSHLHPVAVVF